MNAEELKECIEAAVPVLTPMLVAAVSMVTKQCGSLEDFPPTVAINNKPEGSGKVYRIFMGVEVNDE